MEITDTDEQSGEIYVSSAAEESALLISTSDEVSITDPTVTKTGDSDGSSNAAKLIAVSQKLAGAIKVGSDSSLMLELTDGSSFKGSIDGSIIDANGETVSTEPGAVSVTLNGTSTWTLSGDSYVTEFNGDMKNVITNGYTLHVNGTARM